MKLWYLGSHDTVHRIADKFGVSESTFLKMWDKIVDGTLQHLMQNLSSGQIDTSKMKYPTTLKERMVFLELLNV